MMATQIIVVACAAIARCLADNVECPGDEVQLMQVRGDSMLNSGAGDELECGGGMTLRMRPPWETIDEKVHGSSTIQSCEQCGKHLEQEGILVSGWKCYSWLWSTYLKRPADSTLKPRKPIQSFFTDNVTGAGPLKPATAPLPAALRGVFWLTKQGESSALMTFASNDNADGAWCSYGKLILNKYRVRVTGDSTWAFATNDSSGIESAAGLDLVYDFNFDSAISPQHASISPVIAELGFAGTTLSKQTWLLSFEMEKLDAREASAIGFPGSIVWSRRSYVAGIETKSKQYYLVQVVNEHGERVEPAWSQYVANQTDIAITGKYPGRLFYHGSK
eukprot:TRINITY_DN51165_c0_g1_i1.p1 TRINITY_DN51165_c0_g1~~TRINITY_DN51165_c0_g1_i1.p1  ORF type:complete len:333 (-),score=40.58 TRINITY_DN51165_c0_g1_i1:176-1174(-)